MISRPRSRNFVIEHITRTKTRVKINLRNARALNHVFFISFLRLKLIFAFNKIIHNERTNLQIDQARNQKRKKKEKEEAIRKKRDCREGTKKIDYSINSVREFKILDPAIFHFHFLPRTRSIALIHRPLN